jgi:ribosome-associated protein
MVQEGGVKVNGEVCTARGKKLYPGDKIEFEDTLYEIAAGNL